MSISKSKLKKIPGSGHILLTIFYEFIHLSLSKPFDGLETIGCFPLTYRLFGKMVQAQTKTQTLVDIIKDIKGREFLEILMLNQENMI